MERYEDKDEMIFRREIPSAITKKMGKLWWTSSNWLANDFELGEYVGHEKARIKRLEDQSPEDNFFLKPWRYLRSMKIIAKWKAEAKSKLKIEIARRRFEANQSNALLKAVCKN